jgi:hypothetical protein
MNTLHWETITPNMRLLLIEFNQSEVGQLFYLAGGTALALQLGHRISVDLDFFSPTEDIPSMRDPLMKVLQPFDPLLADAAWGNLVFLARGVRVGFYSYGYRLVEAPLEAAGVRLASIEDIGLMKLDALLARASRKDFHDLYVICQRIPIRQLLAYAPRKYPYIRDFEAQVARRLAYFERAEQEQPVPLLQTVPWETVKRYFQEQAVSLGKGWIA